MLKKVSFSSGCRQFLCEGDGILSVQFPQYGELRARKVISRSNTRPTGRYPSFRMERMIHWRSVHELNAYRLLDCNPAVIEFSEQPCVISYRLYGHDQEHYPASRVKTANTQTLLEIMTSECAQRPEIADRSRLMKKYLPAHGYDYQVGIAEDVGRQPRLCNVRFLLRYGQGDLSFHQREFSRQLFSVHNALLWKDVLEGRHAPFSMQVALRLVLEGNLYLNLEESFGPLTLLSKAVSPNQFGDRHV
jgi:hypothetical protein